MATCKKSCTSAIMAPKTARSFFKSKAMLHDIYFCGPAVLDSKICGNLLPRMILKFSDAPLCTGGSEAKNRRDAQAHLARVGEEYPLHWVH